MQQPKALFSYRPYWAKRFGTASQLPCTREEMDDLGWDSCDIILVTGDAYVDHPSFGMAVIGRVLEASVSGLLPSRTGPVLMTSHDWGAPIFSGA